MDDQTLDRELRWLDEWLIDERRERGGQLPPSSGNPWTLFRALVNTREPWPITEEFQGRQDEVLHALIARNGITDVKSLPSVHSDHRLRLWKGDITTLAADVIVNAANSQLLGCWIPGHHCIDNAIHTFAGVELRIACDELMRRQGHPEATGQAKITPAFNLPSRYIDHTVGPIISMGVTPEDEALLASCYINGLEAASGLGVESIAFCSISTGVFGYPIEDAARVAVATVCTWLDEHPETQLMVIFNVFSDRDKAVYDHVLR